MREVQSFRCSQNFSPLGRRADVAYSALGYGRRTSSAGRRAAAHMRTQMPALACTGASLTRSRRRRIRIRCAPQRSPQTQRAATDQTRWVLWRLVSCRAPAWDVCCLCGRSIWPAALQHRGPVRADGYSSWHLAVSGGGDEECKDGLGICRWRVRMVRPRRRHVSSPSHKLNLNQDLAPSEVLPMQLCDAPAPGTWETAPIRRVLIGASTPSTVIHRL